MNKKTWIKVLAIAEVDKMVYLREIVKNCRLDESERKILKTYGYRACKYHLHQHLYAVDSERREMFCDWLLQNLN